ADLTSLTGLSLGKNQISDISALTSLTNLTLLRLHYNQISDISVLAGMTKLAYLELSYNYQISDISVLAGKTDLTFLGLKGNPLNGEAYCTYLPLIQDNNPGINISYDAGDCLNQPPTVDAGENINTDTVTQSSTILLGGASDPDSDPLTYRWLEGTTVLLSTTDVVEGSAYLNLSSLSSFSIGQHTLTLEVSDGHTTVTDNMILTIENSSPTVAPSGGGTFQLGASITLSGYVSDFDGDSLDYEWKKEDTIIASGSTTTTVGGAPKGLENHTLGGLSLGIHIITLVVDDNINAPVSGNITVEVIDTMAPSIDIADINPGILWPPNHQMVDVVIQANASDISGITTLSATVASSESPDTDGDGNTIPDYTEPLIDQGTGTGIITLQLRSERKGQGTGRKYTITVTATDDSGNSSDAVVEVVAPHDKGKK
ncbi:MAG: leucine-rich repeat domain-containing protein, partial [Planctomycetota bacterium]